ncbi:MAG TPA: hypothetical protein PLP88_07720, partial [Bacteroidales bacterium]|nr:hypothetical protein [Bacteroidales bacterium]
MRRFGNNYGGYFLPENCLSTYSVVYSFGLGEDASFDIDLFLAFGCNIHVFDPTPKSIMYYAKNLSKHQFLQFHPYGIWTDDGYQRFYFPQ